MPAKTQDRLSAIEEVIENGNLVTLLQEHRREERADVAGSSREKCPVDSQDSLNEGD